MKHHCIHRRRFLKTVAGTALAAAGGGLARRRVWAGEAPAILPVKSPNSKLQIAVVGLGGISGGHLQEASKNENLVAICDCEPKVMAARFEQIKAFETLNVKPEDMKQFLDYREMLETLGDRLDGVVVCTPDHNHAVIGMDCMKRGKHILLEKPMCHNMYEAFALRDAGRKFKVATQQGNERHSSDDVRRRVELIQAGAIGPVREVFYWTSRSIGGDDTGMTVAPRTNVSETFKLWSVPVVEEEAFVDYKAAPGQDIMAKWEFGWRGDRRWGTGALGDWGAHLIDEAYWALKISEAPSYKVEAVMRRHGGDRHFHKTNIYKWTIPARADMPELVAWWYDGRLPNDNPEIKDKEGKPVDRIQNLPPKLKELIQQYGDRFDEHGTLFVGEKGFMLNGAILPPDLKKSVTPPPPTIPRAKGSNDGEWYHAIRTGEASSCNFEYSAGLVEHMLTGVLTAYAPEGEALEYDARKHEFPNRPEVNARLSRRYRIGYEV